MVLFKCIRSYGNRMVSRCRVNGIILNSDGSMKTGWLNDNGSWYLFNSDGSMVTGNVLVDGVQYSFASNGVMI